MSDDQQSPATVPGSRTLSPTDIDALRFGITMCVHLIMELVEAYTKAAAVNHPSAATCLAACQATLARLNQHIATPLGAGLMPYTEVEPVIDLFHTMSVASELDAPASVPSTPSMPAKDVPVTIAFH